VSDQFLPTFASTQESRPRPFFDTSVQSAASGAEYRIGRRTVSGYRVTLRFQLRSWLNEDRDLFGFFEAHGGMRDSWLHTGTDGVTRRWRFDVDSLEDIEYRGGGVYSGDIDIVTVG
jgi:hypothetical protein